MKVIMIKRIIQDKIEEKIFKNKIIVLYGARQVGKTTIMKELQKKNKEKSLFLNCDEPDIREQLKDANSSQLKYLIRDNKLIFIDEAQRVKNIGLTLKILADQFEGLQIIASGSSSFDLANEINEPLTGRKFEFLLYPITISELLNIYSVIELNRELEKRILHGMYPEIITESTNEQELLEELTKSYLYKDIFNFNKIKHSEALVRLLQALALQIGNEVSYQELAQTAGIDKKTVESYIDILEKSFIIFKLTSFSRNLRNELKKKRKIYFYDTGIRNAIIKNFNTLNIRNDVGNLWENFLISERLKYNETLKFKKNIYFWRNHNNQEIDFIEEYGGKLYGYEIKWNNKKARIPRAFETAYPGSEIKVITRNNYLDFLCPEQF